MAPSDDLWDDDLPRPKKRKVEGKKSSSSAITNARIPKTNSGSLVGRRAARPSRPRRDALGSSDNEEESPDLALPQYLLERIEHRDREQSSSTASGLVLPPNYDDVEFSDDENLSRLEEKPDLPGIPPPRPYEDVPIGQDSAIIPAPIAQYLKPYQVTGVQFLYLKYLFQTGGILGDDMGLGKTIQVIAFLTAAFGKSGDERDNKRMRKMRREGRSYPRVLIVCPGTLMANWQSELDRWGYWHVYVYHGSPAARDEALAAAQKGRLEIMITTYDSYRNNESAVNSIQWSCVIADECHKLKERTAEITKTMNDINALCRIGLSGTAIQNKYEELWTLLNWANPGKVGSLASWKRSICVPLKIGQSHDATISQLAKARRIATKLSTILLPRFFIRRTKALIAHQLPKKSDRVVFCPLTRTQATAYDNFCDHELVHAIRDASNLCYCGSGKKQGWCCVREVEGFGRWQNHVFPVLHAIQRLSNHIGLVIPSGEATQEKHEKDLQKLQMALPDMWQDLYRRRDNLLTYAKHEFCGKWKVLKKLLRLWHDNGDKVLVFSHSVRLLTMLRTLFHTTDYNVSYLDGSMTYEDRQQEVDKYNSDTAEFVFLISTKAGGVGLNITSANKVVVMDPNWNPAYDLQAQDRAYRIGQVRDVEVFRLVSVGTVEEIVYARQIYKQQQANIGYNASVERRYFRGVQDQSDQKGEIFGLTNLFAPMKENVVLRDIVNKTNIAETRAGVEIAGLEHEASGDEEDDDDDSNNNSTAEGFDLLRNENAAMSALAADIVGETNAQRKRVVAKKRRKDAVQAILAAAGVEYTHENAEVVGTSKLEKKISSRAQKAGNDTAHIHELAFARDDTDADEAEDDDSPPGGAHHPGAHVPSFHHHHHHHHHLGVDGEDPVAVEEREDPFEEIRYRFRPPVAVRRRQFCSMARLFGYDDVSEFALLVEAMTQEQRRDCLTRFYTERRTTLAAAAAAAARG